MYQRIFKPLLFRLDPEQAHALTLQMIRLAGLIPTLGSSLRRIFKTTDITTDPVKAFGLHFANPIGLAAGYDKDGVAWLGLAALGFGHIEIGTVTLRPQPGNPRPRIFRLQEDRALINRMGFPGKGSDFVARKLRRSISKRGDLVLGVNIGKNKDIPNEKAVEDYLQLIKIFSPLADYLVVNVSSPNTEGLRRLQARENLERLLRALNIARDQYPDPKPILVKLAPDLTSAELDDALGAIDSTGMDGIIATNTTVERKGLTSFQQSETGGLSGAPLTKRSYEMVASIYKRTGGSIPIIGVGGIMSLEDAARMLAAGAILVQVYTGLVYAGPGLVSQVLAGLSNKE